MRSSTASLLSCIALLSALSSFSQTANNPKTNTGGNSAHNNGTNANHGNTANPNANKQTSYQNPAKSIDSLKDQFNQLKNSLGFKKRIGDTIAIYIANIEYDDAHLALLKQTLKSAKGVKNLSMNYKGGNATLEIVYKGKATDLWDSLSEESRQSFKLQEAEDNSIVVAYRSR
jgi:hypothetical protein